ncbi:MAG: IS66 family transposase [bacterium]|nr:IS66 family transposase [bacterium]
MVDISTEELNDLIERLKAQQLEEADYEVAARLVGTLMYLKQVHDNKSMSIKRLLNLLFGSISSEKTDKLLEQLEGSGKPRGREKDKDKQKKKAKGHGRNGADAYKGAERVRVGLKDLNPGCRCPSCAKGKVYPSSDGPETLVRVRGEAPIQAKVWEMERLRCNLCGEVFTAETPAEAVGEKYDATAGAMIAVLKYGSGIPFYRLRQLQDNFGIPLPQSTQWEIVAEVAEHIHPVFNELRRQAAEGEIVHNDDTTVKILELIKENARSGTQEELVDKGDKKAKTKKRTGMFTTAIVSVAREHKIAIFHSGRNHAGESLAELLKQRTSKQPPLQMCDALSRNTPNEFKTILANCLAHGRRYFAKVIEAFPDECLFVIETLRDVYEHDAAARKQKMSPERRLDYHKQHSAPLMTSLEEWFELQFSDKLVEPNSSLGQAIKYMQKHWTELTLFLREPGAPLDNNICERSLKTAILHRKNALFYKTLNGAAVGDLFMSLIYTCRISNVNAYDYLTELQRNADQAALDPGNWMPWNYTYQLTPKVLDEPQKA